MYKTITTDEDKKSVTEYKDKLGHVVMKQSSMDAQTYYVYNDFGQLCYVLPPGFMDGIGSISSFDDTNVLLKQFGYVYRYDERGNCNYKRLPGCDPIYMVYDKADRLILSQDGNQYAKTHKEWTVTKYDILGRVIFTGLTNSITGSQTDLINLYKNDLIVETITNGTYTNVKFTDATPLTINYYDNYNFLPSGSTLIYDNSQEQNGYTSKFSNAIGLLTGTRTYILDGTGTNYTTSAVYYDDKGHPVQTRATNHLGGYDLVYNQYDFTEKVLRTYKTHGINGTSDTYKELYTYTYDTGQRLKTTTYSLNGAAAVTLASNTYDELGRVEVKKRHNTEPGLYEYNIQNWPTRIKSGDFEENLYYNKDVPTDTKVCYNGNIAYSSWTYNGVTKGYSYVYDDLNRLNSATFKQGTSLQPSGSFDESYTYDKMGNILTLLRKSNNKLVDELTLHYTNGEKSNQIDWITDKQGTQGLNDTKEYQDISKATSGEFAYDVNGNLIKDLDRDIYTIKYNVLNLPDVIQFKNGNQIKNLYDAGGQKLGTEYFTWRPGTSAPIVNAGDLLNISYSQTSTDQSGTAYIGNIEYNTLNGNNSLTTLSRIYNDEGYVENPANPQYYYFRHDHLGDNREVWCANTNTVAQRTQYYPSGLPWAYDRNLDHPDLQHRKYNGKEFVEMHGYDTYDIVWRQYYPAIMRFQTPDPEVENDYDLSPYTMCDNNMVLKTDPDGRVAIVDNIVGAVVGGLADYGGQVISNYANGSDHPFTQNINLVSIGTSIAVGALTSGVSAFVKGGATVLASTVNNSIAVKTTGSGLKVEVQKNPVNILKNTVIDLTADKLARGFSKKLVGAPLSKVGTTNAGRLNNTGKALVNATGKNVTRKSTETTKRIIKGVAKGAERGTETTLNGVTNQKREDLKKKTNQN